jgi:diketogulonate reductase-like aldo/keto reductase
MTLSITDTFKLNSGFLMPRFGLGTYLSTGQKEISTFEFDSVFLCF